LFGISRLILSLQEKNLPLIIGLFILALLFAVYTYRRTFPPLSHKKKGLLLSLRMIALFCLFLVLSEPILTLAKKYTQKPVVALLVDVSRSMNLKGENISRKDELRSLLKDEVFGRLSSQAELRTFGFADSLIPLDIRGKYPDSLGNATAIGEAVKTAEDDLSQENLKGIVVLSDGTNNLGEDPVLVAKSKSVPIYTSGIGEYVPPRDLSLDRVVFNDIAYVGDKLPVRAELSQTGYEEMKIPVTIEEKKKPLTQENVTLGKSGATQSVDLEIVPQEAGLHQYQISLPVLQDETVKENNQRTFSVKVLKSKIKTLLIAGNLDYEYSFLKRNLEKDKNVELENLVYGKDHQPILGHFPSSEQELDGYDVLILLDPPKFILSQYKQQITDYVFQSGGSALLLLGPEFMNSRAFLEIASLLPFDPTGKNLSYSSSNVNLELTEEGKLHPVTRLTENAEDNLKLWSDLPPFLGVVSLGSAAKDATVLAYFKDPNNSQNLLPAVTVRNYGKGKVMAVTVTPFWRWDFLLWGIGKDNRIYQTLWSNAIRWLVVREDMDLINIFTDRRIYQGGEKIDFQAKIFDLNYHKVKDASVVLYVKPDSSADSMIVNLVPNERGDYVATIGALPPNHYTFRGEVTRDGERIGTKAGEFLVESYTLEDSDLKTNFDLLKRMAEVSGGKYYDKNQIGNLTNDLKLTEREEQKTKEIQLWNSPLLLAIFVLCLSVEWAIRKRSQLL
jgi:uncharacterized membrane protein